MPRDFTITAISASNAQHDKDASIPYVPFVYSIPGPISIRNRSEAYKVTLGDRE